MIPFQIHRRIPLIRRPFYQRDALAAANATLAAANTALEARLQNADQEKEAFRAERDELARRVVKTVELKRAYVQLVDRIKAIAPLDEAMKAAVGGHFEFIGKVEVAILRHYGLKPDDFLVDVGCGSGRLARPLSSYLRGKYSGFDVVEELVEHARLTVNRPDWRFEAIDHIGIPEADGCVDMVCFFSVLTHLLHEHSYWYLEEAKRVLKPGGKIVVSFLEFAEQAHWTVFRDTLAGAKVAANSDPLNVFIERGAFEVWAGYLGLEIEEFRSGSDMIEPDGALGQAICVLRKAGDSPPELVEREMAATTARTSQNLWFNSMASTLARRLAPPERISQLQIFKGYEDKDLTIFRLFAKENLHPEDGFVIDFLGCRTRISLLYDDVQSLDGQLLGLPIPGDFHAEAVEWVGVLKTAMTAKHRYVAMEWGAGWGPWVIAGGKAAQHLGITDIRLYGVEADPSHFDAMRQHFSDNGFAPTDHVLEQAIVGVESGLAQWPDEPDVQNMWGARPIREGSAQDLDYLSGRVDQFIEVRVLSAKQLILKEAAWDMIHMDIQGWEGEVCRSCIDALTERAKWVVIGVHSRIQEAELLQLFRQAGWVLEHEKPTQFRFRPTQVNFEAMTTADGTQVWRNPRLTADPMSP
jgi:FkbM family methyltransferase